MPGGLRRGSDQDLQHPPGRDRASGEAENLRRHREGGQTKAGALQAGGHRHHLLRGQSEEQYSSHPTWNCFASRISLKSLERTQQGFKAPSSNAELQFDAALLTKHSKLLLISSNLQLLPLYCYSSRKLSIFKKLKSNLESLLTFSPCHCDGLICHLSDDDVSTFTQYPNDTRLASLSCNYLVS